ncbi:MAG: hypothetical protein NTZ33_04825 [Bacteroidetes bacterium]|nr:hypothetical protein [Bacteroidota bacterium]
MLTLAEYNGLWEDNFAPIVGGILIPDYYQYIIRENMFEDYLDIFRGFNSRNNRVNQPIHWYYDHPFINNNGNLKLSKVPKIKYILIAEAAPKNIEVDTITYIYNANIQGGGYITAPLRAFTINPIGMNSISRLLNLASNGVLILDLFPFAIKYTTDLRNLLNKVGVTLSFFNNPNNIYCITNRIVSIHRGGLFAMDFKNINPNACLIAPPIISHKIATFLNIPENINNLLNFRIGLNQLLIPNPLQLNLTDNYINVQIIPNSILGNRVNYVLVNDSGENIIRIPSYCCLAYNETRGENPRALFIKNALDL